MSPTDFRRHIPRFQEQNLARNLELVRQLDELAAALGCSRAQLALSWVLSRGRDIVPIPGTKRHSHLDENVRALEVQLSASALEWLDQVMPTAVAGARYNEQMARMTEV
jgi:aryl-alcohol dehydrogenase-like predicted oxidoreductase